MKYSEFLGRRKNTFEKSYELIKNNINTSQKYNVVELGTSRSFVNGDCQGCMNPDPKFWLPGSPEKWDWGAGIFTKVFLDNLNNENYLLYTVDPSEAACNIVYTMCKGNDNLKIIKDYSTNFLKCIDFKIDFLYMDHMESSEEACIKHLEDCKLIIEKNLISENGIILIDDVGDNIFNTKGKYSIPYLLQNGFVKVLHEYQVLLIKVNV